MRLSYNKNPHVDRALAEGASYPGLLVAYPYLKGFLARRPEMRLRDWVLDSGAFSAWKSGIEIRVEEYADAALEQVATDPQLVEVFSLDVIGDWRASLKNTEYLWSRGVPAIPCFHVGEPEDVLLGLARDYPKIALGGAVGERNKDAWAAQCFARVWPKPIHGFGFGGRRSVMMLPWHSVDASNWEAGPCLWGNWRSFGRISVRGSAQNLAREIEWHLELEREARARWEPTWAKVDPEVRDVPTVRLALAHPERSYLKWMQQKETTR